MMGLLLLMLLIHYAISIPDCNKLEQKRDYLSHVGRVTGIHVEKGRVLSVSRDKTFQWADVRRGEVVASHTFTAWCTALQ